MRFERERDMLKPVEFWLRSLGLMTKTEVPNPWGICDVVGCSLDEQKVEERLALRQRAAIGPPFRVALLSRIPDRETNRSITVKKLQRDYAALVSADKITAEVDRLVSRRFVLPTRNGSLQKINGWHPLHSRLISVELKLSRVREALDQAIANRDLTWESYAAFPLPVAQRILGSQAGRSFTHSGIGIVGVTADNCEILLKPKRDASLPDPVAQTHCVEMFWQEYPKDS